MQKSPALLSDIGNNEDASVYKISDDLALVQTLDFITPVIDSAYHFGAIAAANALSDVFAMGAEVINALNIVGFDTKNHSLEILKEMLEGANDKVNECKGLIVGGHTIESSELFFGLSVTGKVHPDRFVANNRAKLGDKIILTKPLGVGILSTALKADFLEEKHLNSMVKSMMSLNFKASQIALKFKVHAMTDITGFGFLGHLREMLNDQISFEVFKEKIPYLDGTLKYYNMGLIPAGAYKNLEFIQEMDSDLNEENLLLCDPQTSGGLLIAIDENQALQCLDELRNEGIEANIVAQCVLASEKKFIFV